MHGRVAKAIAAAGTALGVLAPAAQGAVSFDASHLPATAPTSVAVGDFNGDGLPDVAVASESDRTVAILLANGNGTFRSGGGISPDGPEAVTSVAAGDLTGDGRADVAITRSDAVGPNDRLQTFASNADGNFSLTTNVAVPDDPVDVVLGRINGDAALDAAVATQGGNSVAIRLNDGSGALSIAQPDVATSGDDARAVVLADFDNGVTDMAMAVPSGSEVAFGNGDGTFAGRIARGASDDHRVAVADVDNDGDVDLITGTDAAAGSVTVAANQGAGNFAAATPISPAGGPVTSLFATDLDGDGNVDIGASVGSTNEVRILFGRGGGAFDPPQDEAVHANPRDVVAFDFNRDGNTDVLTANRGGPDLTLLTARGPTVSVNQLLAFGNQPPNTTSAEQTLTLRNNGAPRLRPTGVTIGGVDAGQFTVTSDTCTGANLAIGAACAIGIRFTPDGFGARSASAVITSNGAGAPHAVALRGTGAIPNPVGACRNDQNGTAGNDTLIGTAFGDNLFGFNGNDILEGLAGNDCLIGGPGNDRLFGGDGNDTLEGNAGNDVASGGNGRDALNGGSGRDRLSGGAGNDRIIGMSGNDSISGGAGNDRLLGSTGNDKLSGGPGVNSYNAGPGNDSVNARNGRIETVDCGSGRDTAKVDRRDRVRRCERVSRSRR